MVLLGAGCGHRYLELTVDRACPAEPIDSLEIVVTQSGQNSQPTRIAIDASTTWPLELALELPPGASGNATVQVTADEGSQVTGSATATGVIGGAATTVLTWAGCSGTDMSTQPDQSAPRDFSIGSDDLSGADMAGVDMAGEDMAAGHVCVFDVDKFDNGCLFGP